jgi:hypothetical protein
MNGQPADWEWTSCHLDLCEEGWLELGTPGQSTERAYGIVQTRCDDCEALSGGMNTNFDHTRHCHLGLTSVPAEGPALTKDEVLRVQDQLWSQHETRIRAERSAEMSSRVLTHDGYQMPFEYRHVGDEPFGHRSLYISMHGWGWHARFDQRPAV